MAKNTLQNYTIIVLKEKLHVMLTPPPPGGGGGYSLLLAIEVCAAPKGMAFSRFGLKYGIDFDHFGLQ